MKLFIWLLLTLTVLAQSHGSNLEWPHKYTVKATKILLTSNLVEDYQVWRTGTRSRIDYNNGVVSSINRQMKSSVKKYNIYPKAFQNQSSYTVCSYTYRKYGSLKDILPDTDDLERVGEKGNSDTFKYENEVIDDKTSSRVKHTLWASHNVYEKYWYPVRYEEVIFNTKLGYKDTHEFWVFSEFSTNFSKNQIFNVDSYDCKRNYDDDDDETKDPMFIYPEKDDRVDLAFKTFKIRHGRKYADDKEHEFRRSIFQNNMRLIAATNNKNLGYKLAINKFADRTSEEMKKHKGLRRRQTGKTGNIPFPYSHSELIELSKDLPKEYDLRLYGFVSNVKDQGNCGSCWAFGTTVAVEGALARANGGRLMALASQALVDCAWPFGPNGCGGGSDNGAYEWMKVYGLPTVAEYGEYKNRNGICNIKNMTKLYPIRGYTDVTPLSVEALKIALINHGPLSVSVHVSSAFQSYSSGIFNDPHCSQTALDHEVALVGYGESNGETFWILKNSWGENWGIDGYMHILAKDNACGVSTEPTYVVI